MTAAVDGLAGGSRRVAEEHERGAANGEGVETTAMTAMDSHVAVAEGARALPDLSLGEKLVRELSSLAFLERQENVVLVGPTPTSTARSPALLM